MADANAVKIQQIDTYRWRIPRQGQMRVEGLVFASAALMRAIREDQSLQQVANVAHLPGIVDHSMAMPDIHWGYGFPIGGVAAFDEHEGVISPGGIGYDINCGVRLLGSGLSRVDVAGHMRELVDGLFRNIPSGVGSHRKDLRLSETELQQVLKHGAGWAVAQGYGTARDLQHIEEGGCLQGAQPAMVSARALERGRSQLGSLGSGNHFVEVDYVAEVYNAPVAHALGLFPDQIAITIHTGSRGLGYQVCDDYLKVMQHATAKYGISIPDRQLCCAPLSSPEAYEYIGAMYSAANFAFANRQLITHWVRETFEQVLQRSPQDLQIDVIYDVCHNIGKFETHVVDGQPRRLCVHRKGATRALPPGHRQIPEIYRHLGQPVLIPGDMGRYSYVLIGTQQGGVETFASSCHGAGRMLSRTQAKKSARGRPIVRELEDRGIFVRSAGRATLLEEIPEAYKDVSDVVDVVDGAGISKKVAQLRPIGVIKG
jgi:tRNA-splicing ligase RtcB